MQQTRNPPPPKSNLLLSRVSAALQRDNGCCQEKHNGELTFNYNGRKYAINASKTQTIDLLIATYELAAEKNQEILRAQEALKKLNEELKTG